MNSSALYTDLREIGCCYRCCLRFMGENSANFEDPEQYIRDHLHDVLTEDKSPKKLRSNPCTVCLGILEDSFLENLLKHSCWADLSEYETEDYKINFITPPNMTIRNKAVHLYIKQKHPDYYVNSLGENILALHVVFKLSFKTKLDKHCEKSYNVHSGLQIWVDLHHDNNEEEVKVVWNLDPSFYRNRRHFGDKMFGKNAVMNTLSTVDDKTFSRHIPVPPEIPTNCAKILSINFQTTPIYFGGRYCKYSRQLCQSPWSMENGEIVDDRPKCVQDILFNGLEKIFGFKKEKMTFSASGREDTDVRCLGSGRPFFIKIESVKKTFSEYLFRKLEETVNESAEVSIFDMQQTDKSAITEVKHGEEMKRKSYVALCLVRDSKNISDIIEIINQQGVVNINQNSPVRVAHRRALCVRPKSIFYMKAVAVPNHQDLVQLFLQVQAGTYIKEFINGDFGRTSPSISEIVQADVDIFRLDVIDIDLIWPKHINSVQHPLMVNFKHVQNKSIECK